MTLKIKNKNIILTKLYLRKTYITRNRITGVILWITAQDPDPVFSRLRVTQKDRIRPDSHPQHWCKQYISTLLRIPVSTLLKCGLFCILSVQIKAFSVHLESVDPLLSPDSFPLENLSTVQTNSTVITKYSFNQTFQTHLPTA